MGSGRVEEVRKYLVSKIEISQVFFFFHSPLESHWFSLNSSS